MDTTEPNFYLIRLKGPLLEQWRQQLTDHGVQLIDYVPRYAIRRDSHRIRYPRCDLAIQSVQLQWAWAVLVIGAALVVGTPAMKDDAST